MRRKQSRCYVMYSGNKKSEWWNWCCVRRLAVFFWGSLRVAGMVVGKLVEKGLVRVVGGERKSGSDQRQRDARAISLCVHRVGAGVSTGAGVGVDVCGWVVCIVTRASTLIWPLASRPPSFLPFLLLPLLAHFPRTCVCMCVKGTFRAAGSLGLGFPASFERCGLPLSRGVGSEHVVAILCRRCVAQSGN